MQPSRPRSGSTMAEHDRLVNIDVIAVTWRSSRLAGGVIAETSSDTEGEAALGVRVGL